MHSHKLSVSISDDLYTFVSNYQDKHACKTRSEVIAMALELLQRVELEACYKQANQELEPAEWDITIQDGLDDDKTW